jgi:rubrerythrin
MELKGSRTEQNLIVAFSGESQASNKYTYYAAVAKEAGFEPFEVIFLEAAEIKKQHAIKEHDFLKGIGDTNVNLTAAAEGEHYERGQMYPEFERIAREEGLSEIADFFKEAAEVEEKQEKQYLALLKKLNEGEVFKKERTVKWRCPDCPYVDKGTGDSDECPGLCV